jgi:hypothetical protein
MREIYNLVKKHFEENYSKKHWINIDFFTDEETGFEYFKQQIEQDKDYNNTDFKSLDENDIEVISNKIIEKLEDGDLLGRAIMKQVDDITDKYIGDE